MKLLNLDDIRKEIKHLDYMGEHLIANKLADAVNILEPYVVGELLIPSSAVFNEVNKSHEPKYHSPKRMMWTPKADEALIKVIGSQDVYQAFRDEWGMQDVTDKAIHTRLYKIGYIKDKKTREWKRKPSTLKEALGV